MVCEANISSEGVTGKAWKGQTHENKLVSFHGPRLFPIHSKDSTREFCLFINDPEINPFPGMNRIAGPSNEKHWKSVEYGTDK